MSNLTLSDIQHFHTDILTIRTAGVSLNFPRNGAATIAVDCDSLESLRASLHAIESEIAASAGRGKDITTAVNTSPRLPVSYQSAFRTWVESGHSPLAFEPLVASSEERLRRAGALRLSVVPALLWLVFGYFALTTICVLTAANFEALVKDMRTEPGPILSILLTIRDWMPVWAWLAPLLLLLFTVAMLRNHLLQPRPITPPSDSAGRGPSRNGRYAGAAEVVRRSNLARHAADLIDRGVPPEQAITDVATAMNPHNAPLAAGPQELPPLLQWATAVPNSSAPAGDEAVSSSHMNTQSKMRLVSNIYRGISHIAAIQQKSASRTRYAVILLGGLFVLLISLTVFGPLVELLYFVAGS